MDKVTKLKGGIALKEGPSGECEILLGSEVVATWASSNRIRTKERWLADVQRHRAMAVKCFAECERTCAGCFHDFICDMPRQVTRWLASEFIPAIDPNGLTFGALRGRYNAKTERD